MEWTPEAVKAEMNYRLETARRHNAVRSLRDSRSHHRPGWWRRVRTQQIVT